jgi:hypothetical protein
LTDSTYMNALRRIAAGRVTSSTRLESGVPVHEGSIGVGRGAGSAPARRVTTTNAQLNARIRASVRITRALTLPGGVNLESVDVDNLFGR